MPETCSIIQCAVLTSFSSKQEDRAGHNKHNKILNSAHVRITSSLFVQFLQTHFPADAVHRQACLS